MEYYLHRLLEITTKEKLVLIYILLNELNFKIKLLN